MAKKGSRVQVILECTEHIRPAEGLAPVAKSHQEQKNTPERLELKKFNPILKKVNCS